MLIKMNLICGQSDCAIRSSEPCTAQFSSVMHPSSCVNHVTFVCFDLLLLVVFLWSFICHLFSKKLELRAQYRPISTWQILSAVFNGCLGLVYIGLGIWHLEENLRIDHSIFPIHWWVLYFLNGVTWLLIGLKASLKGESFSKLTLHFLSILAFLCAGISCFIALFAAIVNHERVTFKVVLDVLSFTGASLLLLCTCKGYNTEDYGVTEHQRTLYTSLNEIDSTAQVTPFAKAGLFSKMSFCWLNPLMKFGKEKILEEEDLPKLRDIDRAGFCYSQFLERLSKYEKSEIPSESSILWTIVGCHWTEILVSGLFALLKILAVLAGPLLLNSFIEVAEGKVAFRFESYILAISLFLAKMLESLSQRQWYFRSRLIGLRVQSMLTAALYSKQLRLSNAARSVHSGGEIMNHVTVDAYRIGEFPFWFHQTWATCLQICFALLIIIKSVGLATIAALLVIVVTVLCNTPLAKLQHKFQTKLMVAQDERLKACTEAIVNMKVLKLYAWETHFKNVVERLRNDEYERLSVVQSQKAYNFILYWTSPVLVSAATFVTCYFLGIPLHASNVFTFVATLGLVQEPIRAIPEIIGVVIQARVSFSRIAEFLKAPELQTENVRKNTTSRKNHNIRVKSANLSWDINSSKPTLRNINLDVHPGEKIAICGEVGAGKSTLLAAILGEVPYTDGTVEVYGKIAYVSQTAWIQTGTLRENILFGSSMNDMRYQETLHRCSLVKDLELLPYGDLTEIGERGVNLSGGQKQRIQLARALYQDADIYLLDDPFSAVDAQTATNLFNEYVMEALSGKTVVLVTHQVDFIPAFHCCLMMSDGKILKAGTYHELLASSSQFLDLVNAHQTTVGSEAHVEVSTLRKSKYSNTNEIEKQYESAKGETQLIGKEEKEVGNTGLKPYLIYLNQRKGYLYFSILALSHIAFLCSQIVGNTWMASSVDNPQVNKFTLIMVYVIIGLCTPLILLVRSLTVVTLGMESSKSLFSQLLKSLFRAPMSFYDSTPLGRILSRISSDLSLVDLDIAFSIQTAFGGTTYTFSALVILAVITWQVLFVSLPAVYMAILLQRYYFATAKELMRLNGTTKSKVASHLAESVAGAMTIRAFKEEERFISKTLNLIDTNASPNFHNFAANEWLIHRIEILGATILAAAALCMLLLPPDTFSSGFIGMALSYGLALNMAMVFAIQNQCTLANHIVSVERLSQYMDIESEAPEFIKNSHPPLNWPSVGKVDILNLQIRYRPNTPLILRGISCTFEGGDKIGIVGRTGSGKTTLIGALFRLVEPVGGKIIVDGIDICSIGLHDLRSHFGIIPQDPTLFNGTVRFNLDPLSQHDDEEIWKVLDKCQLKEAVDEKNQGLDSLVMDDGCNWSMGQRQLFCLGRALLKRSRVLVLDEATASIDNTTDMILQKTIRSEFGSSTVIIVAHRIPTVMDCTKVLAISDGKLMEYDEPMKLMKKEGSLFKQLVMEYWSHSHINKSHVHEQENELFKE
ncbi:ABC transporter C family member 10-like isoform X2 [Amaranthus tricolor]|uniref:ABC transporter C family member 10-like isoform X2 n=2 Tax=Amaranthus tricolor TaxID=29722 RepID=UPI00258F1014|nr:ABC transporter C family member 10-like isoform X2 [Amaranthus tricolor]